MGAGSREDARRALVDDHKKARNFWTILGGLGGATLGAMAGSRHGVGGAVLGGLGGAALGAAIGAHGNDNHHMPHWNFSFHPSFHHWHRPRIDFFDRCVHNWRMHRPHHMHHVHHAPHVPIPHGPRGHHHGGRR